MRHLGALVALALPAVGLACKREPRPDTPAIRIVVSDTGGGMPGTLPAGIVHLRLVNVGVGERQLLVVRMTNDVGTADRYLERRLAGDRWPDFAADAGGTARVPGGDSSDVWLRLPPGRWVAHFGALGAVAPDLAKDIMVRRPATAPADTAPPDADLALELRDDAFTFPASVATGQHVIHVANLGTTPHAMDLYRVPEGRGVADLVTWSDSGRHGPPPLELAGGAAALLPGGESWTRVTLSPGRYVILCDLPRDAARAHHALGLSWSFVVE